MVRCAAVVPNDSEHLLPVGCVALEGTELFCQLCACRVRLAGHERADSCDVRARVVAVIWDAEPHEGGADIGVAESQRPVLVALARHLLAHKLGHQDADLEHDGHEARRVPESGDVKTAILLEELDDVEARQIAGGVIEKDVFTARITCVDSAVCGAGMPLVDRRVILDAGIGGMPGCETDFVPEVARLHRLPDAAVCAFDEVPVSVLLDRLEEAVWYSYGVVCVLTADSIIRL